MRHLSANPPSIQKRSSSPSATILQPNGSPHGCATSPQCVTHFSNNVVVSHPTDPMFVALFKWLRTSLFSVFSKGFLPGIFPSPNEDYQNDVSKYLCHNNHLFPSTSSTIAVVVFHTSHQYQL
eukprot:Gb_31552 [translate_table: standard]